MPDFDEKGFCEEDRELLIKTKMQVDFIQQAVWELKKDIRGNGRPGLLSRMDRIETRVYIIGGLLLASLGLSSGVVL